MNRNQDIKDICKTKRVRLWRVAEAMGIRDSELSRLLRYEITAEKRAEILNTIDRLSLQK
jgi:predicted XRE-type DNA-binding protein